MRARKYILLGVVICFFCVSTQAIAEDLCALLQSKALKINGNGYAGGAIAQYNGLSLTKKPDGTYTFESAINFPATDTTVDKIVGTCKDRHIVFTRTRPGAFVQIYDGWIFEAGGPLREMARVFSHNGPTQWGWYGQILLVSPK